MSARPIVIGALVFGLVAVLATWTMSGSSYTLHAHFLDAGRLVPGGEVQVAGRSVGSISGIGLTRTGEADVTLSISDEDLVPLHSGTRAAIRAFSQGSVDGNVVVLTPGSSAAELPSGAVLSTAQTSSTVDIDALLDSFGPAQRANLDGLIANLSQLYAGSGSAYFNRLLGELQPALGALNGTTSSLALDRGALGEFVRFGSEAANAVASRRADLTAAVTHTAQALSAIASQKRALADALSRMPGVLQQARGTLARADTAVTALRPTLRDVVPAAPPLHDVLSRIEATLPTAGPMTVKLRALLPALDRSLSGLTSLKRPAVSALVTLGPAMKKLLPVAQELRFYAVDTLVGSLAGLFGNIGSEYDEYGHYAKVNYVESPQLLPAGPLASALAAHPLAPGTLAVRTGLTRRCPGGAEPPAPDGSSPWVLGSRWCTAADDLPLSVDFP